MTMSSSYLLCSSILSSSSSSSFPFKFEFPTKSSRSLSSTVIFRPNSSKACHSLAPANHSSAGYYKLSSNFLGNQTELYSCCVSKPFNKSSIHVVRQVAGENDFRFRRGLLFTSTLPFILSPCEFLGGFAVKAEESGTREYQLIKDKVRKVVLKGKAAGVLRLVFHDAGTFDMDEPSGGMNGSIIYELERPENAGLKKSLKILEKAKSELDASEPVSWADLIAVAGAEAVSICGGPEIHIALGRTDSVEPDPEGKLPQESLDASGLKKCFQRKGLSVQDLVALSGAHTLGSKGFGSPTVFDNSYFKILLEKPWKSSAGMSSMIGLPSDRALVEDEECTRWISNYANDQNLFFEDFKAAYIKLVNMGARWKNL